MACLEIAEEGGSDATYVQRAGRARSEASSHERHEIAG